MTTNFLQPKQADQKQSKSLGRSNLEPHLTPEELSEYWQVNKNTLRNWRCIGQGPRYRKIGGSVRYPLSEVHSFETEHEVSE